MFIKYLMHDVHDEVYDLAEHIAEACGNTPAAKMFGMLVNKLAEVGTFKIEEVAAILLENDDIGIGEGAYGAQLLEHTDYITRDGIQLSTAEPNWEDEED